MFKTINKHFNIIFIKLRSAVFGIQHLKVCINYTLCYNAQGYCPLLSFNPKSQLSTMNLFIVHTFHASFEVSIPFRLLSNTQFVQNTQ